MRLFEFNSHWMGGQTLVYRSSNSEHDAFNFFLSCSVLVLHKAAQQLKRFANGTLNEATKNRQTTEMRMTQVILMRFCCGWSCCFFFSFLPQCTTNYIITRIAQNFSKCRGEESNTKVPRFFFFYSPQGNKKMKANLIKFKIRNRSTIFAFPVHWQKIKEKPTDGESERKKKNGIQSILCVARKVPNREKSM